MKEILQVLVTTTASSGPVDIPWIDGPVKDLDPTIQWVLFGIALFFGYTMEVIANTRFFWPCTSDVTKLTEAFLIITFYWVSYSETETSRLIIIMLVYLTQIFDVASAPACSETESEHWNISESQPLVWDKLYGVHFGIRGIVKTVELLEDARVTTEMAHAERRVEQGFFYGKGIMNAVYYFYGLYLLYIYYAKGYNL